MFFLHFIADFLLQSREMGKKKSSNIKFLCAHVGIQMLVFFVGLLLFTTPAFAITFAVVNGLIHGIIDALIWKGYALIVWVQRGSWMKANPKAINYMVKRAGGIDREPTDNELKDLMKTDFKYWEDHWFYATIGFDQFLHMSTIVLVYMVMI